MSSSGPWNALGQVPKLGDHNWNAYSVAMGHFLDLADISDIVLGTRTRPANASGSTGTSTEQTEWDALSRRARAYLFFSLSPGVQYLIEGAATAPEAWKKLREHYEKDTHSHRVTLRTKMWRSQHDTRLPVTTFIHSVTSAAAQLAAMNAKYKPSDEEIRDAILAGLDPEFSQTKALLSQRSPEPTLADITAALVEAEAQWKMPNMAEGIVDTPTRPDDLAMIARNGSGQRTGKADGRSWGNPSRNPNACDRCGGPGHAARDCFAVMPNWFKTQVRTKATQVRYVAEEPEYRDEDFAAARAEEGVYYTYGQEVPHI